MAVISLDNALNTQGLANEQRSLIDLIAKLQFAQLDNVKLPQIVVVGDQSAGKSSVLEAITGTPFPRDAGACTRFATEIRLRRAAQPSLKVTIIPDKNRPYRDQEALLRFGGSVDSSTPFDTMMRAAVDLIAPKNIPGRFAARDILVVEKQGPDMPLLTLVDLPGLVRNANNDQSLDDIRTIEALSDRYMKSSRTIILAVVGGNSDYVQAPILTKARHFDPNGTRTIGVLTKPDLTESIGLEEKFIDLVCNKDQRNHFKLGWYVLLNPGPREPGQAWPSAQERSQREHEFFTKGRWTAIPGNMQGADALRKKLSEQLQRHIGRHLPVLRRQIQKSLDETDSELKQLGEGKDTVEEMKLEMVEMFSESKELAIPALLGFYKNPPRKNFFRSTADPNGTPARNLRARAIEENERFSHRVRINGRKFSFTAFSSTSAGRRPMPSADGQDQQPQRPPEDPARREFVDREVQGLLKQIRGSEFPTDPKPRAVYMLFQNFSENWPRLAQEHKDNLGVVCSEFISELIDFAWPERMREPLTRLFVEPELRRLMDKAQAELELLTQDMHLEIQPYDPEYEERLQRWHDDNTSPEGGRRNYTEAEEVLEKMLIYYELSAKTFIRNVITQVVERHLLGGMYTLFNAVAVLSMDNVTVEAIAAENRETRDRRQTLKAQKKAIEEARDLCSSLAMRRELRAYAEEDRGLEDDTSDEEEGGGSNKTPTTPRHYQPAAQQDNAYTSQASPSSSRKAVRTSQQSKYIPSQQNNQTVYPQQHQQPQQQQPQQQQPQQQQPRPQQQQQLQAQQQQWQTEHRHGNPYASGGAGGSYQPTPTVRTPAAAPEPSADDYYAANSTSKAPQQAPPPPPRPDKVRSAQTLEPESPAASDSRYHHSSAGRDDSHRSSRPPSSGSTYGTTPDPRVSTTSAAHEAADYMQNATRKNPMRKILGRG
ncbi:hypothetical protein RB595_008981 [Gaeumannomyces hyphopodioides]